MRFTKLFISVGVTALAMFGAAVEDGALKMTGLVNDVRHYTMSGVMSVAGTEAKLNGTMTQKVIKVEDNGNITMQDTESMKIEVSGQELPSQDAITTTVYKPDGTVIEVRGEESGPNAYRIATIETINLPDFALAVDKTWTHDFPADAKTGVIHSKGEYKVLASETLHGVDSWKLSTKVTELSGDTPASTEGTAWISKKDGSLVKMDGKATNLPVPQAPGGIVSGTEVIELAPSKDK